MNFMLILGISSTEKARIEAQIRAAEVASSLRAQEELRIRRERERDAARIAIQKVDCLLVLENSDILLFSCLSDTNNSLFR